MGIISVEDALLAKVKATLGHTVRQTESLPGGWTLDMLQRALQHAPGVYVAFQGLTKGAADGYLDGRFTVYAVTKGPSEHDRRRGNARVIGAYDIIERLVPVLGFTVPDVGTLRVTGVDNLFRDAMFDLGGTVYGIQLTLPNMPFDYQADLETLADFATFDAQYDVPPHESAEEYQKWLQAPPDYATSEPDAHDTLTGLDQ